MRRTALVAPRSEPDRILGLGPWRLEVEPRRAADRHLVRVVPAGPQEHAALVVTEDERPAREDEARPVRVLVAGVRRVDDPVLRWPGSGSLAVSAAMSQTVRMPSWVRRIDSGRSSSINRSIREIWRSVATRAPAASVRSFLVAAGPRSTPSKSSGTRAAASRPRSTSAGTWSGGIIGATPSGTQQRPREQRGRPRSSASRPRPGREPLAEQVVDAAGAVTRADEFVAAAERAQDPVATLLTPTAVGRTPASRRPLVEESLPRIRPRAADEPADALAHHRAQRARESRARPAASRAPGRSSPWSTGSATRRRPAGPSRLRGRRPRGATSAGRDPPPPSRASSSARRCRHRTFVEPAPHRLAEASR